MDDIYKVAGRAYCRTKFDYNPAHYGDGQAGADRHMDADAESMRADEWFITIVNAAADYVRMTRVNGYHHLPEQQSHPYVEQDVFAPEQPRLVRQIFHFERRIRMHEEGYMRNSAKSEQRLWMRFVSRAIQDGKDRCVQLGGVILRDDVTTTTLTDPKKGLILRVSFLAGLPVAMTRR